jgi:hypothetical protein
LRRLIAPATGSGFGGFGWVPFGHLLLPKPYEPEESLSIITILIIIILVLLVIYVARRAL